jgi:hypothetical protein
MRAGEVQPRGSRLHQIIVITVETKDSAPPHFLGMYEKELHTQYEVCTS